MLENPLTCTPCDPSCATCDLVITNCTSCSGTFLHNNACLAICPDYFNGDTNVCYPCADFCLTCSGNSSSQCTSCGPDGNGTQLYIDANGGTCNSTCSLSYLNDSTGATPSFQCNACDVACTHCFAVNLSSSCYACDNAANYHFSFTSNSTCTLCNSN